jgi:hypothetical protein
MDRHFFDKAGETYTLAMCIVCGDLLASLLLLLLLLQAELRLPLEIMKHADHNSRQS